MWTSRVAFGFFLKSPLWSFSIAERPRIAGNEFENFSKKVFTNGKTAVVSPEFNSHCSLTNEHRSKVRMQKNQSLGLEQLENRLTPTTQASFSGGVLTVLGDTADNNISVAADAAGNLTVTDNGQSIAIQSQDGSAPTKFNLNSLYVDGGNG